MTSSFATCWAVVEATASGDREACGDFCRAYLAIVRRWLAERWRGRPAIACLDDAVQEVFLDLFRVGGALDRLDRKKAPGFRAFLFGVARNVALRHEERLARARLRAGADVEPDDLPSTEASMSSAFDRHWALGVMRAARERLERQASSDPHARRRVEILRLRFHEGLPIRDIAARFGEDPAKVHHEFARAREEFKRALRAEIAFQAVGPPAEVDAACRELLRLVGKP